jgi:hypothetical protein
MLRISFNFSTWRRSTLVLLAGFTGSCGGQQPYLLQNIEVPGQEISGVLERIRQDVGYYEELAASRRGQNVDPDTLGSDGKMLNLVCSTASYDFDVSKITPTLTVYTARTDSGDIGLKIPFGPPGVGSIGPDINGKNIQTATQTLTFDRFYNSQPTALTPQLEAATVQAAQSQRPSVTPIADTLVRLRKSLIQSAQSQPCFSNVDKDNKSNDTIKIDFIVEKDADPNVGFNLYLVSAKAGHEDDTKNTSSLMVTFVPHINNPIPTASRSIPHG